MERGLPFSCLWNVALGKVQAKKVLLGGRDALGGRKSRPSSAFFFWRDGRESDDDSRRKASIKGKRT